MKSLKVVSLIALVGFSLITSAAAHAAGEKVVAELLHTSNYPQGFPSWAKLPLYTRVAALSNGDIMTESFAAGAIKTAQRPMAKENFKEIQRLAAMLSQAPLQEESAAIVCEIVMPPTRKTLRVGISVDSQWSGDTKTVQLEAGCVYRDKLTFQNTVDEIRAASLSAKLETFAYEMLQ
jgi:hypothetical protein